MIARPLLAAFLASGAAGCFAELPGRATSAADGSAEPDGGPDASAPRFFWATGDTHLHAHGCGADLTPAQVVEALEEEDLDVGSALIWGVPESWSEDVPHFTGSDDPASLPDHILRYDLEVSAFPAAAMGHLNLLGLSSLGFSPDPYSAPLSGVPIIDWALENDPGVLVGSSHLQWWPEDGTFPPADLDGCCTAWEFPIHVARERLTFLEVEQESDGALFLWRSLLNSGFRVPLVGASDFPCISGRVGEPRTHVLVEGELTYEGFLDGIRQGRTVVVGGGAGHVELGVDGARVGDEIRVAAGESVSITVDTNLWGRGEVTILANGESVQHSTVPAGARRTELRLPLSASTWISARAEVTDDSVRPRRRGWAWTSAVYVLVDDEPIRGSASDVCYLVRYVDHLNRLADGRGRGGAPFGPDTAAVFSAYDEAREVFIERHREAGGGTCP